MKAMLETERSETSQQKCRAVWEMYILYMEYIYIYLLSVDWYQTVTAVPGAKCQRTVDSGVIFSSKCGAKNPQNHWVTYGLRHTGMAPIRTPKIGFYQKSMGRLGRGRMSSNTSPPGDQHQWCQAAAQSHLCGSAWKASLWPLQKKRGKIEEDFAYVIQVGRYPRWIVMWRSEMCVCVLFPQLLRPLKPIEVLQSCWTSRLVLNRFHLFIGPLKVVVSIQPRLCWRRKLKFRRKWMGRKDQSVSAVI